MKRQQLLTFDTHSIILRNKSRDEFSQIRQWQPVYPVAIYFRKNPSTGSKYQWVTHNHLSQLARFWQEFRRVKKFRLEEITFRQNPKYPSSTGNQSKYLDFLGLKT